MTCEKVTTSKVTATKKVFCIILVIVVSISLLSVIASAFVFNVVFQRKDSTPYELRMEYSFNDTQAHPRQSVEFFSESHMLKGYIYGASNNNGIIVIVNGFNATSESHLAEIFYFVDNGWIVFSYDGTGTGKSDGKSLIGLEQARKDVLAAVDFIEKNEQYCDMPIFLYGHSAGGYAVSTICDDIRIKATVCISGFNSPCEIMKYYGEKYAWIFADFSYPFMLAFDRLLFGEDSNISARDHIKNSSQPILIIHGTGDEIVPLELSIYDACRAEQSNNIKCLLIDDEYKNRHSTIWLTADAAKEYVQLQTVLNSVDSKIVSDAQDTLIQNAKMSDSILRQVDYNFLKEISDFFSQTLYE